MIVSHSHKIIFIKPRKVAGTSFEIALSKFMGDRDIITPVSRKDEKIRSSLGFRGAQNFQFPLVERISPGSDRPLRLFGYEMPMRFYNHIPAKLARRRLGADVWDSYRKISLVRNPWDRAISLFYWRNTRKDSPADIGQFAAFCEANIPLLETNYLNYFIDGADVVDTYIRYEHFEQDLRAFEREMPAFAGLWETFRGINAKGEARDRSRTRQEIFAANPSVDTLIRGLNGWEIEKFGYNL